MEAESTNRPHVRSRRRSFSPRPVATALILGAALIAPPALANAGVFFGNGYSVRLDTTEKVQMVSEEVTITPGRGRTLFTGGVPLDWVDYTCKFELRNLTDEKVEIQVGFPLTSQFHNYTPAEEFDELDLVHQHRFLARDNADTYHVRFVARDLDKRFGRLFLWKMTFAPNETKTLHVSYGMRMSLGMATTRKDWQSPSPYGGKGTDSRWMRHADASLMQYFGYVTETGASWAGEIEHARFRLNTRSYEQYIEGRGWDEPVPGSPGLDPGLPRGSVFWHRTIEPAGGTPWSLREGEDPRGLEWTFAPFEPGPELSVRYYFTLFPKSPEAMRTLARYFRDEKEANLDQLRGIVLALQGVEPTDESVLTFAEAQVWYEPTPWKSEADLQPEEVALLTAIDEVRRDG